MPGGLGRLGPGTGASFGQRRQGFGDAIVFTVGGGCMEEYGNLQEWARRSSVNGGVGVTSAVGAGAGAGAGGAGAGLGGAGSAPRKRVVYGSTEIVNAEDFLMGDLKRLGLEN